MNSPSHHQKQLTFQGWYQYLALFCNHLHLRFLLFSRQLQPLFCELFPKVMVCSYLKGSKAMNFSVQHTYSSKWIVRRLDWLWRQINFNGPLYNYKTKQKQLQTLNIPTYWQGMSKIILLDLGWSLALLLELNILVKYQFSDFRGSCFCRGSLHFRRSSFPRSNAIYFHHY